MVYIHEGGFFAGSIHTLFRGPHYFMDTGEVILVLMTYRLGVMGKAFDVQLKTLNAKFVYCLIFFII